MHWKSRKQTYWDFLWDGFIAQELALNHTDRVGKLIIYASLCGVNESILPSQDI